MDIGTTWLGRIYDEHGRALLVERGQRVLISADGNRTVEPFAPAQRFTAIFRENDWNDYRIIAIGPRMAVFVNGTLFAELVDHQTGEKDLEGDLAFQLHSGPETRVEFRSIALRQLTPADVPLGAFPLTVESANTPRETDGFLPTGPHGESLNLDFELGDLTGWTATGDAFENQPVQSDTISQRWRGQVSNKQGQFFIGGYEVTHSDKPQGTLTSPWFNATAPFASFLVAGGAAPGTRVDVISKDESGREFAIASASGNQREQMRRTTVDLRKHMGQQIAIRLIDQSSGGWGHLNFDDFRFHTERPQFPAAIANDPLFHPLLHHLVENPDPESIAGNTLAKMSVPDGFAVDLIAAEPTIHQPMAFTFDAKGRLWVVEGHSYPTKRPAGQGIDRVVILEDQDHDGRFETRKVFTEGLNLVSGMQVGYGGVWIGAAPELLFIPDRNGDDQPDGPPQVLLDGFGYADTHETLNSFVWGPDGWLYGNQGVFNQSLIGKPGTDDRDRVRLSAGVWRYHPIRHAFEVFAHGGSNQWGLDYDDHGQWFMTHCRSHFGRGPTTHVIQGGHYWNQTNSNYAHYISNQSVSGIEGMPNYMLASARYGHGEGGAGKRGSKALYGGHSHVGTMIYLGDNWPAKYRNHLFTHNLHGHQINHQINVREGGGFNTIHAGYDVFHCADPQYIGVDLQCGPDGAVYLSDWYDPRHCHNPNTEQWQRGNGRLYRMRYDGFQPADVNYIDATDQQLVRAQLHPNDWHVRMARLVLAHRASERPIDTAAVTKLKEIATTHQSPMRRLRGLWCLHVIGSLDTQTARKCISDRSEYVRSWTVQLLAESKAVDEREALIVSAAAEDTSLVVRRHLASAARRLDAEAAWSIVTTLNDQAENANDRNLTLLIWYAIADLIEKDTRQAEQLIDTTRIPVISRYLRWYLPQTSEPARESMVRRLEQMDGEVRSETLRLFAAGLRGTRNLNQPRGWDKLAEQLYQDQSTRPFAFDLGAAFGDPALFAQMRAVLSEKTSSAEQKVHALSMLSSDSSPANLPLLLDCTAEPELRLAAIRQLRRYDQQAVANKLIELLPTLSGIDRDSAMETLSSRPRWAISLLDAIAEGRLDSSLLTGFFVRQMANLQSQPLRRKLESQWGQLGQSSEQVKAKISSLVTQYRQAPLWAYNANSGAAHFKKLCANCHIENENTKRIGPKLEGSGAKGIEYIVENIVDPSAVVGKDFQSRLILTVDGLVVTGVVLNESDSALTVRTATSTQTIAKNEIERIVVSEKSLMPEGLLKELNDREQIELLKYLMSI